MHRFPVIKQSLAGLLMLLFAFSITPRKAIHDWFAGHEDGTIKVSQDGTDLVDKAGYHCKYLNLVATSPFLEQEVIETGSLPAFAIVPQPSLLSFHFSTVHAFTSLRGPPVA